MRRARTRPLLLGWIALSASLPLHAVAQPSEEPPIDHEPWVLRMSGELGAGTRDFDLPVDGVVQETRTGLFPALGLGFELDHVPSPTFTFGLLLHYQTSVALGIVERHTDGSEHPLDARSHALELAFVPSVRLDRAGHWELAAAAGYSLRDFRPEAHHLVTPAYGLGGPHLRLELRLSPFGRSVRLRVGPEVQWIAHIGADLRDRGIAAQGYAFGGEAGVEIVLGEHWLLHADYRELRSRLGSSQPQPFEDVARFVTAGLTGTL